MQEYNCSKIKYYSLNLKLEISENVGVEDLNLPGIFVVKCLQNGRLFFVGAENVLYEISKFFQKIRQNEIKNDNLLTDLEIYGEENFIFVVLNTNFEFENQNNRNQEIFCYQKENSSTLY